MSQAVDLSDAKTVHDTIVNLNGKLFVTLGANRHFDISEQMVALIDITGFNARDQSYFMKQRRGAVYSIGQSLYDMDGFSAMNGFYDITRRTLGQECADTLEEIWRGLQGWQE